MAPAELRLAPHDEAEQLEAEAIELRPPVREAVPRPGAWLGELLQAMGFVA